MTFGDGRTNRRIVVISGPVGSGKSTLAKSLTERYGFEHVRTQELLRELATERGISLDLDRKALQDYGDEVDLATNGEWVAQGVGERLANGELRGDRMVIDSVRRFEQIEHLRAAFPLQVTHINLDAPNEVLSERYEERRLSSVLTELSTYDEVAENPTEAAIGELKDQADVSIDTKRNTRQDVLARAAAALRVMPSRSDRLVDVIVGGQYGSEGKGNIAFHIANDYDVLMRVGGPNAGHKVPTDPPFTHRLLPSGTLANGTATLLIGPGATLDLDVLLEEIDVCKVEVGRLFIDPQAIVIEDEDKTAEIAMTKSIGSTGKGGGAAAARRIMGRVNPTPVRFAKDVDALKPFVRSSEEVLEQTFADGRRVLLEGTQGTALSLYHGQYPFVTSRDTTTNGCLTEAGIGIHRVRRVIMVVRTYPIRVGSPIEGDSGGMSWELTWSEIADRSGNVAEDLLRTERGSVSGTQRRVGEFDWGMLARAAELNGATEIALTFADYVASANKSARRYDQLTAGTIDFIEEIERVAGVPVTLIGTGFDRRSLIDRRAR